MLDQLFHTSVFPCVVDMMWKLSISLHSSDILTISTRTSEQIPFQQISFYSHYIFRRSVKNHGGFSKKSRIRKSPWLSMLKWSKNLDDLGIPLRKPGGTGLPWPQLPWSHLARCDCMGYEWIYTSPTIQYWEWTWLLLYELYSNPMTDPVVW